MNADTHDPNTAGTIVLIHGLWMTPLSWEHWVAPLREPRLPRARAGLAGHGRRRRGAARATRPRSSTLGVDRDRRPLRRASSAGSTARRSSWATPSAALFTADPARPRPGRRRRGDRLRRRSRASCTCPLSTLRSASRCSRTRPTTTARSRSRPRSSTTRSPTRSPRRSRGRSTSATPCPGPGRVLVPGRAGELQPARRDHGRLPQRRPRAAAAHRRRRGPRRPGRGRRGERRSTTASRRRSPSTRSSPAARTTPSARTGWEEVADYALDWAAANASTDAAPHTDPAPTNATPALA